MKRIEPELTEVIEAIWGSTLQLGVEHSECAAQTDCPGESVSASIDILGSTPAVLLLECSNAMASEAARKMFKLEQTDLGPQDLIDAVSELVNILAGNIRCLVSEGAKIGLPVITTGEHAKTPSADSYHFESNGMPFHISVTPQLVGGPDD